MKEKLFMLVITLSLVSFTISCESIIYETHSSETFVSLMTPDNIGEYEVVGNLSYNTKAVFLIYQLITLKDAEIDKAILKQVKKMEGDGVINLNIHEQYDFVDFVVSAVGLGIVNTRTVKIDGDIIKMKPSSMSDLPNINHQLMLAIVDFNKGANR